VETEIEDSRTEWEKMLAGERFDGADPIFALRKAQAAARKAVLDAIPLDDMAARVAGLQSLFGLVEGPCIVLPPFTVEFGTQVRLGTWVFVNTGATFLDNAPITLGDRVAVGPNVMFLTATHPVRTEDRYVPAEDDRMPPFRPITIAKPITVERDAWIGAGAILLPGVSIGAETVVGAGSVVTRSLPPRVVAAGNPARVLRAID
jgi:maltose O-acetyltransferase